MTGTGARWANDILAFLLELAALGALAYWGFTLGAPVAVRIAAGAGAPALAATVWGLFAAPRARFPLPTAGVLAVKALVFGAATIALFAAGAPVLAVVFAVLVVANTAAVTVLRARYGVSGQ
ncbi:uncharacterized protein DUF2568 [Prauserella shujinwangii]|uniref:Uncharacterized protein DUF2568 n=1 Tax=Prauserella shujinwangii TaxID=1453103 RepID=A0A2T0LRG8_9PSEU|nr:YrdB family protein [Prauserella shujinwangii]PRX46087.1 uncharacterized protein DUF2568 [Prauserella shujinwangii]